MKRLIFIVTLLAMCACVSRVLIPPTPAERVIELQDTRRWKRVVNGYYKVEEERFRSEFEWATTLNLYKAVMMAGDLPDSIILSVAEARLIAALMMNAGYDVDMWIADSLLYVDIERLREEIYGDK